MRRNPNRNLAKRQLRRIRTKSNAADGPTPVSDFVVLFRWVMGAGLLALLGLVLAAYFTPMLAIERIEVQGANRIGVEELEKQLQPLVGELLTQVSEEQVASLLAEFKLIDTVGIESRPPNSLLVKIQERQPVVIVRVQNRDFLFDAAGVQIAEAESDEDFPTLIGAGVPSSSTSYRSAVDILLEMPNVLYNRVDRIEIDGAQARIRIDGYDFDVVWGSSKDSALKAEVLNSILESLTGAVEFIDVSSPLAPVVKY